MNPCAERERYLDGRSPAGEKEAFEAHLEECPACGEAVEQWRVLVDAMQSMGRESPIAPPTTEQREALLARARELQPVGRRQRWVWAAGGLVAAAAALLLVFFWPRTDKAPGVAPAASEARVAVLFTRGAAPVAERARQGTRLAVPRAGRLLLRVGDDLYGVGAHSELGVARVAPTSTRLRLRRGVAAFAVKKRHGGERFEVEAGPLIVRVVGTRFLVGYHPTSKKWRVAVGSGVVEVEHAGQKQRLSAGQELSIGGGGGVRRHRLEAATRRTLSRLLSPKEVTPVVAASRPAAVPDTQPAAPAVASTRRAHPTRRRPVAKVARWREWVLAGELERARRALKKHLRRAPRDVAAWSLLASCERKARRWRAAVSAHRRLIRVGTPAVANQARFAAGTILQDHLAQPAAALKLFRAYLGAKSGPRTLEAEALLRAARALLSLGRSKEALPLLRRVMEKHRGTPAVYKARRLLRQITATQGSATTP